MQNKVLAGSKSVTAMKGDPGEGREILLLVDMVYRMSSQMDMDPEVFMIHEEGSLWLYYENTSFECEELLEEYGAYMALISREAKITLHGTAGEADSVEIAARLLEDGKSFEWVKKDISGQNFDRMTNICVRIDVDRARELELTELYELFQNMSYRQGCAAVRRTPFTRNKFKELAEENLDTYYCYLSFDGESAREDEEYSLEALSIEQKKKLWLLFLQDGVSPLEFEMMMEALEDGRAGSLFPWELSLRIALSESGVRISYEGGDFQVNDRDGRRLKFDYQYGTAAEKLFLKLLFPVKGKKAGEPC